MWRLWYVVGVVLAGFGLVLVAGTMFGYANLAADQSRVEQRPAESEDESELRMRQVMLADIEDGKRNNLIGAAVGVAVAAGGVAVVAATRRRRGAATRGGAGWASPAR